MRHPRIWYPLHELGGKSPVIAGEGDMEHSAERYGWQDHERWPDRLAPDYVFVPENRADDFVAAAQESVKMFKDIKDNPDYLDR